jgi:hypothetical protein
MEENKDFGLTNVGETEVVKVPVELKDHSKDPVVEEPKPEIPVVPKRKRGRPKKAVAVKEYYCATCRERYLDSTVMKIGAGSGRHAIFCPNCQKSLGFSDVAADEKMAKLLKNPNKR